MGRPARTAADFGFVATAKPPTSDGLYARVRCLPNQLEAARRRVRALENEARRYGLTDLLQTGERS